MQFHDAHNLDVHMLDDRIQNLEISCSDVGLRNFRDAKVNIQNSNVHIFQISENNKITLDHSKLLIDNAYFMKNAQNAIMYDKDGTLYINDDITLKSKMCFISVLKAFQNKLETQLDAREDSILKAKRKESERLLEISRQIAMLQQEQEKLLNDLDKARDNIYLSLTNKKIKEIN